MPLQVCYSPFPFDPLSPAQTYQTHQIIEQSAELISEKLRYDENIPDLDEQFRVSSQEVGQHRYFVWPYKTDYWGEAVEHVNFVPLPQRVKDQYQRVECASFMGLIPEIHR